MTRKLLPYEHDLIQQLGVTEDEYLDFLAVQFDYTRTPEQKLATPQKRSLAVFIVLTVVGILFQVASVLLMPKPEIPGAKNQRRAREQRFSPRFGFNSSQELGQYGDPVNLVYCNTSHNPIGGVRIGTSLVWSSVESYGSTQFMQLLLVLGAASIKTLDFERTAFGQLPLGQFSESNTWLYYEDNGPVNFNNKLLGDGKDPTRDGAASSEDVCRVMFAKSRRDGYSQAFSPSSLASIGVYDPIPLNIEIQERRATGRPQWGNLQITIAGGNYGTGSGVSYAVGNEITVVFAKAPITQGKVVQEAAKDIRYQLAESLDRASIYMLGTAKFRLVSVNNGEEVNLDDNDVRARFECIEAGRRPVTEYDRTKSKLWTEQDRDDIGLAIDELEIGAPIFSPLGSVFPNFILNNSYSIRSTTDEVGVADVVLRPVDWINEASIAYWNGDITLRLQKYGFKDYNFQGNEILAWTDELGKNKIATFPKGGSIATTQAILQEVLSNKPKISTKALRDAIEDDLEKLRQTIDDLNSDDLDDEFREAAKQRAEPIRQSIRERQKEIQKILDEIGLDKKEVKVKKDPSGTVDVLNKNTDISKDLARIEAKNDRINELQEEREALMSKNSQAKKALIQFYRNTSSPFTAFGNSYGSGGIKAMKRRLAGLKGQLTTDQIGVKTVRKFLTDLIENKKQALRNAKIVYRNWEEHAGAGDNDFFTKCLVKIESAAYQTVTVCDFVKFAIRCKLFRRISGRAKDYGQNDSPEGYRLSDNGIHGRMAFFKVSYRETKAPTYQGFPVVFAVRRGTDQDNFIGLAFKGPPKARSWEFKFDPIGDIRAETFNGETHIAFIENEGKVQTFTDKKNATFGWTGSLKPIPSTGIYGVLKKRGPLYTNEWDLFSNRSDTQVQFSFDGGPELRITSVTEQQAESIAGKYANLSMMALGVFSGRGVQDLRAITAYVTQGKSSWIVNETTGARTYSADSTSFAPDIFADTILDTENGIGKFAKSEGIDWNGVALAKRFCKNNGLGPSGTNVNLFMDGVIAEQTPWRQFWAETAPFSLLEFARVGGRETLIPAVPVNAAGRANREVLVNALFTAGNVLEGSYKEEFIDYGSAVQDLIATVIYRDTKWQDVFPRNSSVTVSLKGVNPSTAISQSFDVSQFVTQEAQSILFAKLLCNQRRHIRRGIEFKTFPTDTPISPGAYIYVDIGLNTWERVSSGLIMQGGELNAPLLQGIPNGSYSVLAYKGNTSPVSLAGIAVSNGVAAALAPYAGYMFVLGAQSNKKRVFRVTEVQMDEEGEVTIKAMEHPCDDVGGKLLSRIANFSDSLFNVS
jgi:hypothetical protein